MMRMDGKSFTVDFIAVSALAVARQWSHPGAKKHKIFLSLLMSGKMFSNPDDLALGPKSTLGTILSFFIGLGSVTSEVSWVWMGSTARVSITETGLDGSAC